MRPPRSNPRLNLRFRDHHEMDEIDLRANQEGLDLQNWVRQLVRHEIKDKPFRRHLAKKAVQLLIKIYFILETLVDPKVVAAAEEKSNQEMQRLKHESDDL